MTDPKLIEAVARAIYEGRNGAGAVPWSRRDGAHKAPYRWDAKAAVDAYEAFRAPGTYFANRLKREWFGPDGIRYEPTGAQLADDVAF